MCTDETPMVKKAAASRIGKFANVIEKEYAILDLIPVYKQLVKDEQDTIRILCIESLVKLVETFNKEENQKYTLTVLLDAGEDKSWKVRLAIAKNFGDVYI
jgi:serine/threonine-protein phosphatase 2A regulatory subunit A